MELPRRHMIRRGRRQQQPNEEGLPRLFRPTVSSAKKKKTIDSRPSPRRRLDFSSNPKKYQRLTMYGRSKSMAMENRKAPSRRWIDKQDWISRDALRTTSYRHKNKYQTELDILDARERAAWSNRSKYSYPRKYPKKFEYWDKRVEFFKRKRISRTSPLSENSGKISSRAKSMSKTGSGLDTFYKNTIPLLRRKTKGLIHESLR